MGKNRRIEMIPTDESIDQEYIVQMPVAPQDRPSDLPTSGDQDVEVTSPVQAPFDIGARGRFETVYDFRLIDDMQSIDDTLLLVFTMPDRHIVIAKEVSVIMPNFPDNPGLQPGFQHYELYDGTSVNRATRIFPHDTAANYTQNRAQASEWVIEQQLKWRNNIYIRFPLLAPLALCATCEMTPLPFRIIIIGKIKILAYETEDPIYTEYLGRVVPGRRKRILYPVSFDSDNR
jgi:hypothetical protein